jgi:hypothetical protein
MKHAILLAISILSVLLGSCSSLPHNPASHSTVSFAQYQSDPEHYIGEHLMMDVKIFRIADARNTFGHHIPRIAGHTPLWVYDPQLTRAPANFRQGLRLLYVPQDLLIPVVRVKYGEPLTVNIHIRVTRDRLSVPTSHMILTGITTTS